jgi:hypothetical protein
VLPLRLNLTALAVIIHSSQHGRPACLSLQQLLLTFLPLVGGWLRHAIQPLPVPPPYLCTAALTREGTPWHMSWNRGSYSGIPPSTGAMSLSRDDRLAATSSSAPASMMALHTGGRSPGAVAGAVILRQPHNFKFMPPLILTITSVGLDLIARHPYMLQRGAAAAGNDPQTIQHTTGCLQPLQLATCAALGSRQRSCWPAIAVEPCNQTHDTQNKHNMVQGAMHCTALHCHTAHVRRSR